ncbi:MAG: D-ribose pyranase [Propionibacteriaceae bacterium]|nr:D-ribose pyranase [Propionibacteriaceae bacterium]
MKKSGILNPQLARAVARLGHRDTFVVADCGLPIPREVEVIDLSVVFGIPRFIDVLDAILSEVVVEGAVIAEEARSTDVNQWVSERLRPVSYVPHEQLKVQVSDAAFVVRTGETTSYANIIVRCGVPF